MPTGWAGRHEALVSPDGVAPYGGAPWLSRRARRCSSGATPGRPQGTPAVPLPPRRDGRPVLWRAVWWPCRRPFDVSPSAWAMLAQRVTRCDHHRTRNCLPRKKLPRAIQVRIRVMW
jgi:hypothetical protein